MAVAARALLRALVVMPLLVSTGALAKSKLDILRGWFGAGAKQADDVPHGHAPRSDDPNAPRVKAPHDLPVTPAVKRSKFMPGEVDMIFKSILDNSDPAVVKWWNNWTRVIETSKNGKQVLSAFDTKAAFKDAFNHLVEQGRSIDEAKRLLREELQYTAKTGVLRDFVRPTPKILTDKDLRELPAFNTNEFVYVFRGTTAPNQGTLSQSMREPGASLGRGDKDRMSNSEATIHSSGRPDPNAVSISLDPDVPRDNGYGTHTHVYRVPKSWLSQVPYGDPGHDERVFQYTMPDDWLIGTVDHASDVRFRSKKLLNGSILEEFHGSYFQ